MLPEIPRTQEFSFCGASARAGMQMYCAFLARWALVKLLRWHRLRDPATLQINRFFGAVAVSNGFDIAYGMGRRQQKTTLASGDKFK
jgi:hypothetical protein